MVKLTEAANLQIVHDNLLAKLCLNKGKFRNGGSAGTATITRLHASSTRSNKLALYYFEQSNFEQSNFEQSNFEQSSLDKRYFPNSDLQTSGSLQSPSLQRILRWMSVKGDHI